MKNTYFYSAVFSAPLSRVCISSPILPSRPLEQYRTLTWRKKRPVTAKRICSLCRCPNTLRHNFISGSFAPVRWPISLTSLSNKSFRSVSAPSAHSKLLLGFLPLLLNDASWFCKLFVFTLRRAAHNYSAFAALHFLKSLKPSTADSFLSKRSVRLENLTLRRSSYVSSRFFL